jgi:hypothetical protein
MRKDEEKLLITGGIILLGYFGIIKPILTKVGIFKSAEERREETDKNKKLEQQINEVAKTQTPTKSAFEWQAIADQIYENLRYTALDDNKDNAAYQAARVKNDADFLQLWKSFGSRQEYAFGLPVGSKQNLQQFLLSNLSDSKIKELNNNYSRKNIKFRY